MGKILAILAASAAVAGGGTYAFFHYANPYKCSLGSCEVTRPACCAGAADEPCPAAAASPDATVAAAGPVGMFVSTAVPADGACCASAAASRRGCCADAASPAPTIAALVGPAAAVR